MKVVVQCELLQSVVGQQYRDTLIGFVCRRDLYTFGKLILAGKQELPLFQQHLPPLVINLCLTRNLINKDMLRDKLFIGVRFIERTGIEKSFSEYLDNRLHCMITNLNLYGYIHLLSGPNFSC